MAISVVKDGSYLIYKNWACDLCDSLCICTRKKVEVEILVVTHNHVRYISECLASVGSQVLKHPTSVVVHDDNSDDGTFEKCLEFLRNSNLPISIFRSTKNQFQIGRFSFLAKLLRDSKANFTSFLDGDDYWLGKEKLNHQLELMKGRTNAKICHTRYLVFRESERVSSTQPDETLSLNQLTSVSLLRKENYIGFSTVMIRNDSYQIGKIIEGLKSLDIGDYPIWCALIVFDKSAEILFLDHVTTFYRIHNQNYWASKGFFTSLRRTRINQKRISKMIGTQVGEATLLFLIRVLIRRLRSAVLSSPDKRKQTCIDQT